MDGNSVHTRNHDHALSSEELQQHYEAWRDNDSQPTKIGLYLLLFISLMNGQARSLVTAPAGNDLVILNTLPLDVEC
jgi:hypothetical protein